MNRIGHGSAFHHAVQFYEDDAVMLDHVGRYLGSALEQGDAAIVLARRDHRADVVDRLTTRGPGCAQAIGAGRYLELDAEETLRAIMRDGWPDRARFNDVVTVAVDRAASAVERAGGRVTVFGELVALLCADGRHEAAIRLEQLWNDLARIRAFSLLCAYPTKVFPRAEDGQALVDICAMHTEVAPAESLPGLGDSPRLPSTIALREQKAYALETEIEARQRAEAVLRQRETELADFVDQVPVALNQVASDGTILWANHAELELLGYPPERYFGRNLRDFHVDQGVAHHILSCLAQSEILEDREARLRRSDGSVRHVLISTSIGSTGDGVTHTRCVTRDVTERIYAEEATARLVAIVDSSDDAIIGKLLNGTVTSWNRSAERLYGYAADEIIGRSITTIVPLDRRHEVVEIMARLAQGERIAHHETERLRKDGTRVEVSVSISPIRDGRGRITGAATIARDITERRDLERKKQQFLTMVAHDLRSPLAAILGYAQLLGRRKTFDERAVTTIASRAGQMSRLITDVLEAARSEAGRLELRRTPIDLAALIGECIAQVTGLTGILDIRLDAPEQPVCGQWDADRLTQVFVNLLDNAAKYGQGGEIFVRVTGLPDEARVAVMDRGPGIAPDALDRIFDRFARATDSPSAPSGVGLGLFISKTLVEAHGGRIWVESELGRGSTFTVFLPYAPVKAVEDESNVRRDGVTREVVARVAMGRSGRLPKADEVAIVASAAGGV
jgi:PAS domain S-box-containing protein